MMKRFKAGSLCVGSPGRAANAELNGLKYWQPPAPGRAPGPGVQPVPPKPRSAAWKFAPITSRGFSTASFAPHTKLASHAMPAAKRPSTPKARRWVLCW